MGRDWVVGSRLRMTEKVEYDDYVLEVGLEGVVDVIDDEDALVHWDDADAQPRWLLQSDSDRCAIISLPCANVDFEAKDMDDGSPNLGNMKLFGMFCGQVRLQKRLLEFMLPLDFECPIDLLLPLLNYFVAAERQSKGRGSKAALGPAGSLYSCESQGWPCKHSQQKRVRTDVWKELRAELLLDIPDSQIDDTEQFAQEDVECKGTSEGWWSVHERTDEFASSWAMQRIWSEVSSKMLGQNSDSDKRGHQEEVLGHSQVSPQEVDLRDEFWKAENQNIKWELTEKERSLESSKREPAVVTRQFASNAGDSVVASVVTAPSSTAMPQSLPATAYCSRPTQHPAPTCAHVASQRQQSGSLVSIGPTHGEPESLLPRPGPMSARATHSLPLDAAHRRNHPFRDVAQSVLSGAPVQRNSASRGHLPTGIVDTAKAGATSLDRHTLSDPTGIPGPAVSGQSTFVPFKADNATRQCLVAASSSAERASTGFANDVAALREIAKRNPDLEVLNENPWLPDTAALDLFTKVHWKGVVTKEGRVTEMHTRINCLPSAVGRLSALTTLNLTSSISLQSLPYAVSDLRCLDTLKLGACKSLGALPASLARLQALTRLDLWHCACLSRLPAALPTSLKVLNLNGCTSLEELPPGLRECACLQALDVSSCASLASLPTFLADMHSLACPRGVLDVRNCPGACSPVLPQLRAQGCRVQT